MHYDFTKPDEFKEAIARLYKLRDQGQMVSIIIKRSPISNAQASLINTLQTLYCIERGERLLDIKAEMESEYFKSRKLKTADNKIVIIAQRIEDMDKGEASIYISWIYHWAAARECVLPTAEEIKQNKEKINKLIGQHRPYL